MSPKECCYAKQACCSDKLQDSVDGVDVQVKESMCVWGEDKNY